MYDKIHYKLKKNEKKNNSLLEKKKKELMTLYCDTEKESWESLGQQGDQVSQS